MARLEDYDTTNQFVCEVKESTRISPGETEEVRDIILEVNNKDLVLEPGQSVGVIVPGPHGFGHKDHFRLYTIADIPKKTRGNKQLINICVRRCTYIDDFSGERYEGIASNYLCDLKPGDKLTMSGPYGIPFEVPDDKNADILMIGLGTGIAPFRAFVKRIYNEVGGWKGKVRLFHGARSGLELLYMNDKQNDFTNYYDEETFKAFEAVSPRPQWDDPIALDYALEERAEEVWKMVTSPDTYVFVAGQEKIKDMLDRAFEKMAGSKEKWERRKAELKAGKRWTEVIY